MTSTRSPDAPQPAVSVLLVRKDEVFIQHRALTMDFAAGAVVFPGGRVDHVDHAAASAHPAATAVLEAHAQRWSATSAGAGEQTDRLQAAAVLVAAAIREVSEETGALVTPAELTPWANWITPATYAKRFDTFFYLMLAAPTLNPQHQTTEAVSSEWAPVQDILAGAALGRLQLMRPTETLLKELVNLPVPLATAVQRARASTQPVVPIG